VKVANILLLLLACLLLTAGCGGCRDSKKAQQSRARNSALELAQYRDDMLLYAVDNLNRLEEFSSPDALDELLQRFAPQNATKANKPENRVDPLLAAWPEPEMFHNVVERLNQWVREQPPTDWKLDPMVATLPKLFQDLPQVKNLDKMEFTNFDGFALQEATWLRDISQWAKGDSLDELDRAKCLFDWTVRNVQLVAEGPNRIPQFPRETLLFGRGSASDRAWLFILLLRQLDIDAALLAIDEGPAKPQQGPGTSVPGKSSPDEPIKPPHLWCVGVLIEGQVYLFDPMRGLPIPAPDGVKLDESGQLAIRPATLAQVAGDDKLLRRMDCDESRVYGIKASNLKRVTALLEASPPYLARSMKAIQSQLTGERKMVLSIAPGAQTERTQADRWKAAAKISGVQLWLQPYQVLAWRSSVDWRVSRLWLQDVLPLYMIYEERQSTRGRAESKDPLEKDLIEKQGVPAPRASRQVVAHSAPLNRGRVLYLKGKFTGEEGAIHFLQIARPSNEAIKRSSADDVEKLFRLLAKQDASYWLGLISYQRGNYDAAVEWFMKYTIEAYPEGRWTTAARYNLARAYEAKGESRRAILLYGSNADSAGYEGDLLRAKWLRELGEKQPPKKD
jgi:hypothetical protein